MLDGGLEGTWVALSRGRAENVVLQNQEAGTVSPPRACLVWRRLGAVLGYKFAVDVGRTELRDWGPDMPTRGVGTGLGIDATSFSPDEG